MGTATLVGEKIDVLYYIIIEKERREMVKMRARDGETSSSPSGTASAGRLESSATALGAGRDRER